MERTGITLLSSKDRRFLDMPKGIPNGKRKLTDQERIARIKLRQSSISYKAKVKARRSTPEYKAIAKAYRSRPDVKEKIKKSRSTPEYKEKRRLYEQRPEQVAKDKAYRNKPDVKAKKNARARVYNARPDVIEHREEYNKLTRPHRIGVQKARRAFLRYDVLMNISNAVKPKCACCGLDDHIDFLSLDHVQGRKQMDNIKEITDIGYSSELQFYNLLVWIRENEYLKSLETQYFQVLCHNCNFAKGMVKNKLTCPHKHGDMK